MVMDAPIKEYDITAIPLSNAVPFMPIICSVEILEAMSDAPMIHHGRERPAKKIILGISFMPFWFSRYPNRQPNYKYKIRTKNEVI